ncbi:hypothetical protein AAC387_Pa07g0995 [Persea americana]
MVELRSRIMRFRDILDLSPCKASTPMNELLMVTVGNLQKLYPNFVSCPPMSDMITASSYQVLHYFYESLKSVGDSWTETHNWCNEFNNEKDVIEDPSLEQLGEMVMDRLGYMNAVAKEFLYVMDEKDEENAPIVESTPDSASEDFLKNSGVYNKLSTSPHTPTSVLTDATPYSQNIGKLPNISYSQPILLPLRLKAIKKLMPTDVNCFSFHMLPHASIQNFSPANQSNEKSDPDHCETRSDSKALPMDVSIALENSMTQMDETSKVLNHVSHDIMSEKDDNNVRTSTKSSVRPPNPLPLPILPAKESALPPLPQPQLTLKSIQSATPPLLQPKQSAPPAPPPPMLPLKQSSSPFLLPLAKQSTCSTLLQLPMLPPKESTLLPPLPSPPVIPPEKSAAPPLPSSPVILVKGLAPPPPPPLGANKSLRPKKASTKLKRSTQMGSLYRLLKGKVEGSNLSGKLSHGKILGGSADNKAQGMADALAEITKRSAYFQKIEEDVQKHATSIMEMKSTINSFQTNNMADLQKFHQYLEFHLENLTDETQVLARFDDFPTKKLETIRTASVMLSRLDGIATNLESWKVEAPMAQHLKKVECYFNKIKTEVDAIECKKDEEARRFRSHNIEFDFDFLLRIKEFMVDVSSNCIEMVLKESNEVKADADREGETKLNARLKSCSQSLWKAFQLAYRVYNFAGGQDDRADKLTKELAQEIETFTNHY